MIKYDGVKTIIHCDNKQCSKKTGDYEESIDEIIHHHKWLIHVIKHRFFECLQGHFCSEECRDLRVKQTEEQCSISGHQWKLTPQSVVYFYRNKDGHYSCLGTCERCGIEQELNLITSEEFNSSGELRFFIKDEVKS